MTKEELTAWALGSGWKMIGGHPSLSKPNRPGGAPTKAIVRIVLKATVAHVEVKKPAGKWEKVAGAAYGDITEAPDSFVPHGLGLESIPTLSRLIQDNRDAMVFGGG